MQKPVMKVPSSFICNSQRLEISQCLSDKQNVVYLLHNGILLGNEKGQTFDTCKYLDESQ